MTAAAQNHELRAFGGEKLRNASAYAGAGPGYQGHPAAQLQVHRLSLPQT